MSQMGHHSFNRLLSILINMITAIVSFLVGVVVGILVFRKNRAKFDGAEAKGKDLLAALKGDK